MNTSSVFDLYASTVHLVFSHSPTLFQSLSRLRTSLSCSVCYRLLKDPYSVPDACKHYVCRTCVGGKIRSSCSYCKDPRSFVQDEGLRLILECYKNLCKVVG